MHADPSPCTFLVPQLHAPQNNLFSEGSARPFVVISTHSGPTLAPLAIWLTLYMSRYLKTVGRGQCPITLKNLARKNLGVR